MNRLSNQPMLVYLSLGANLGNREQTIRSALLLLGQRLGTMQRCSSFFYSDPWGFDSPNPFCNVCAAFDTDLSPIDCLHACQTVERLLGKDTNHATERPIDSPTHATAGPTPTTHYHDRPIDIDIILFGDLRINTPELTIPHPHYRRRDFLLIPLREIKPDESE